MYYYIKSSYGQKVLKSSQEYGKEAIQAGLTPEDREWRYLSSEGKIECVDSRANVDGLMIMEEIRGGYDLHEGGKYAILVKDHNGQPLILPGRYPSKSAATRFLPGLSMTYDYVAVLGDDIKPWVSRADVNYNLMDDISF